MNENKNIITIVSQAFYGNRVETRIKLENLDRFILGYISSELEVSEEIDRTIINLPNTDDIVLIYNKHQEERKLQEKEMLLERKNYALKPLAIIPELDLKLYSRCIVCRMNEQGEFESLKEEDFDKFMKYLCE